MNPGSVSVVVDGGQEVLGTDSIPRGWPFEFQTSYLQMSVLWSVVDLRELAVLVTFLH